MTNSKAVALAKKYPELKEYGGASAIMAKLNFFSLKQVIQVKILLKPKCNENTHFYITEDTQSGDLC